MTKNRIVNVTLLLAAATPQYSYSQEKPNILWLVCEDISPNLSFYGDSTAHTPNLDQLAKESLVFTNAFTTVGVSAPSRSSIITGMYPISIGTMHMRTAKDIHGIGNRTYDAKSNAIDIEGNAVRQYAVVTPDFVKCFTEYLRNAGYYCSNNAKTDYQFASPVTAWDENDATASWVNCPKGKPFFSVFNDDITHESRIWHNKALLQTVSPKTVPLPPYYPDDSIVRQDVARNYSNIELLDKHIGEKLDALKKAGLYDKTIIFFYSDNGGPLPRGKREVYDSGLRLPFMVHFPGGAHAGRNDELISYVDLAPTILSLASIKPPSYMQGQAFLGEHKSKMPRKYIFGSSDRFDESTDRIRVVRDGRYLFVKNYYPQLPPYKNIGYRRQMDMMNELLKLKDEGKLFGTAAQWFQPTKAAEEFYDCQADPFNIKNRIADPQFAAKIKELRKVLDQHIIEMEDKAIVPEAKMVEQMWPGNKQPKTACPIISIKNGLIQLSCSNSAASIGYILSDQKISPTIKSSWQLYNKAFKGQKAKYIYVIANRIGFSDSEIIEKEL